MNTPKSKFVKNFPLVLFFSVSICVFICFLLIEFYLNKNTEKQISELFVRERVLQTIAVGNSLRENIGRIKNESSILANYSFPEFEQSLRTPSSIKQLLKIELDSYQDVSAYRYFDFSGEKNINV